MQNNSDNGNYQAGTIAVAVDEGIASQSALRWAIHNFFSPSTNPPIKLVYVINPSKSNGNNTSNEGQTLNASTKDFLLAFRCYCTRKRVECDTVVLEDQDVAKAYIDYIYRIGVETFVIAHSPRNGLSRLFKTTDVSSRVLKGAPDFCTVYVPNKGKLCQMRHASRPLPNIQAAERAPESDHIAPSNAAYDEVSVAESDFSFASSERQSTDSILSFYQNLGSTGTNLFLSESPNWESIAKLESDLDSFDFDSTSLHELSSSTAQHSLGTTPFLSQKLLEEMEDEIKRLRVELKQTKDMYNAACKEAKQKTIELEDWKMKEGKKLEEARLALEATRAAMEKEKANPKAAIMAADHDEASTQRFAEEEVVQPTINAD